MEIREILARNGFTFKKKFGQNFLTDANLRHAIVRDSGAAGGTVLEIGTGAGTLTRALARRAKRVVTFEVDKSLASVLDLSLRGLDNVEVVFRDVLKMSDDEIADIVGEPFKVVANLPYYITTPLIMRFIESDLPVKSLTVMVQKEVAARLSASVGSADYAAITLAVQAAGGARITRDVGRKMFFPSPNVDSAVVHIDIDRDKLKGEDAPLVRKLIRSAFAMRRKTLANNLSAAFGLSKEDATALIEKAGFKPLVRGEALSLDDFVKLSRAMKDFE